MNIELEKIRKEISLNCEILERDFSLSKIGVFGSVAKGTATEKSDIDFLVEFKQQIGLFEFAGLNLFLENIFQKKVDIGTPRALKSMIRDEVLKSVIYI
ncbi:MAG: nucleotidyltransferase family protein [Patescibacteria group bacterium]